MSDELILEIDPPYIGSAVSPTVDIAETTTDVTVTITDFQGDHSYTIEKTDQAISDAEQAATNANNAASQATATANAAAQYARDTADQAAADAQETADEAAGRADTAAASANQAAQSANTAAGTANTSAQNADAKAALADSKAALANTAATTANQAAQAAEAAKTAANTAAGQATTAAGTANTAASNADAKAALADAAAANADTATQAANTATTNATNAAQAANNAAYVAIEAAETITDGYFPKMLAGAAESLMDETDTATFAERVSSHDGVARIESIQGNTVVFNQIMASGFARWSAIGGTASIVDSVASFTASESGARYQHQLSTAIAEHKYISLISIRGDTGGSSLRFVINNVITNVTTTTAWQRVGVIGSSNNAGNFYYPRIYDDSAIETLQFRDPQLFDLTRMFGAGNEPATVEEFEALFPDGYYPYNAGELLSVNIEGVNDREIPVSTYFPDGMKSAGSVYDELTMSKTVKRVAAFTFDSTNAWFQASDGAWYFQNISMQAPENNGAVMATFAGTGYSFATTRRQTDKYIATQGSPNPRFWLSKGSGETLADIHALVDGQTVYYALYEPVETEITPPLTMTYTVESGGTEQIVIPTGEQSAAPTMAIVYGLTIDGVVDKALSVIAPIEGATASTNYSVNAYLVHDQQLYRVTSAIATGEAITPGSNCVACTVMGELARLTA